MRYVVLVPLFFFVAYGADQPAEPIPNEEKSSGNSAQDGSQTSALEHELLIQSFAYDLGSNVGKTTPFVNIHFFTSYLSALGETNLEDLAYRLSSQFELRNLDDGTLVDVDRTVLATDEEGFQYRLEFAPKVDLSSFSVVCCGLAHRERSYRTVPICNRRFKIRCLLFAVYPWPRCCGAQCNHRLYRSLNSILRGSLLVGWQSRDPRDPA